MALRVSNSIKTIFKAAEQLPSIYLPDYPLVFAVSKNLHGVVFNPAPDTHARILVLDQVMTAAPWRAGLVAR